VFAAISPNARKQRDHQRRVGLGELVRDFGIGKRDVAPVDLAPLRIILAAGHQVRTVRGTVDGYFAFGSTTNRANAVSSGGAEPLSLAFIADRADQGLAPRTAQSAGRVGRSFDYDITSGHPARCKGNPYSFPRIDTTDAATTRSRPATLVIQ
jgi:hypothetical protein